MREVEIYAFGQRASYLALHRISSPSPRATRRRAAIFTLAYIFVASGVRCPMKSPIVLSENPESSRRCTHVCLSVCEPGRDTWIPALRRYNLARNETATYERGTYGA